MPAWDEWLRNVCKSLEKMPEEVLGMTFCQIYILRSEKAVNKITGFHSFDDPKLQAEIAKMVAREENADEEAEDMLLDELRRYGHLKKRL